MSQSLIIFKPSGKVLFQTNKKISPFNDFIHSIVAETHTELEPNFYTTTANQKRFYCFKKDDLWAAIYFDIIITIDGDKIKHTLIDVLKTYVKLTDEGADEAKIRKLIDYQFDNLVKLKKEDTVPQEQPKMQETNPSNKKKTQNPPKKAMRKWVNGELVEVGNNEAPLDYSELHGEDSADREMEEVSIDQSAFSKENDLVLVRELNEILGEDEEDSEEEESKPKSGFLSKVTSYFGSTAPIDEVSKKFNDQLISKNIAPPTAKAITEKIKTRLGSKTVTVNAFKQALTEELTKILTPNVSTDLLYEIKKSSAAKKRPYVISVVGVNGVGKSTNLAKLAYWLLQNNLNVLICACDTFRSGAVEQLKVHVKNLKRLNASNDTECKIDLFEKGYGGGDHVVKTAKSAIQHATTEGYDIVLIDTAGRTHSNAKLMAPLKKFGDAADPDKIIMVGEALVGTDSVEQAINFNNAFGNKRNLDFFIISKVDTVGDLVGAMINMVMATNVPILFVGTGQTYTDIKRLSVKRVVDMLTK
ncbi:SRP54-type protein, GTPase domain family protein [Clavispora lusitaniae]|uniref:SRP54-type protein, GTPase domain family protein n=1 Tax=Clavispora lusitaniae TaxID=36911 RepID=UPI00202C234B|nr:SRP54-type protein, GTPase domain family protein [Clavispora lusitaniae]